MNQSEILCHIDHTLLQADCRWQQIQRTCRLAEHFGAASACIPPTFVERCRAQFAHLTLCTVIGFPLGYHTAAVKAEEARQAIAGGADEIDLVVNLGDVKDGRWQQVEQELRLVRAAAGAHILKVIVEACYLTREEKIRLCRLIGETGADYIKTSTGFGSGGAVLEDVALFRQHLADGVKIKAAGGIRTLAQAQAFLQAGCERIGSSAILAALAEKEGL